MLLCASALFSQCISKIRDFLRCTCFALSYNKIPICPVQARHYCSYCMAPFSQCISKIRDFLRCTCFALSYNKIPICPVQARHMSLLLYWLPFRSASRKSEIFFDVRASHYHTIKSPYALCKHGICRFYCMALLIACAHYIINLRGEPLFLRNKLCYNQFISLFCI